MSDVDKQPTEQNVDTGGGSYVQGDANVGADLIGRDKINAERVEINYNYGVTQSDTRLPAPPTPLPDVPCPYRGLEFFDTQHAPNYFGRQEMTAKLVAKVQECNFIAVVGPSGSGKSSLVRAGLMVALQKGALTGSGNWKLEIFRPGENPLQSLAGALLKLNPSLSDVDRWTEIEKLAKRLGNGKLSIGLVLEQIRGSIPKLLLIVDQFEETFTLCMDEKLRASFLDTLLAATDPKTGKPWLTVIFTLRADFYGHVLEREALSKRVDAGLVNMLPMTHEERRAAIEQPALQAGRHFESGLVERIVAAVEAEPGQLPLLEFALTELWTRQSAEGRLTHTAYEAIGEVSGAIAKRADNTLRSLPKADQERVRTIFTRLVRVASPDEGSDDTKRRLLLDELDPSLRPLVQSLADARLLVTGRDEQQKSDTVEVAHEALIRGWDSLQTWLNSDREFLLWRQRLRGLVENWIAARKDEGSLLRGATLGEAEGYLAARANEISASEREFIEKSRQLAEQEAQAKEAATRQLRRRNQFLTVALGIALIALLIAGYFWDDASRQQAIALTREAQANSAAQAEAKQRATAETALSEADAQRAAAIAEKERADHNAADAEKAKRRAQADGMAARVEANITQMNGVDDAIILLARKAVLTTLETDGYVTISADAALRQVVDYSSWRKTISGDLASTSFAVFSPNATVIATAANGNTIELWDFVTGREVMRLHGHKSRISTASFSSDGSLILSGSDDGTLKLWDAILGKELRTINTQSGSIEVASLSPDGHIIVAASQDGSLKLWNATNGLVHHTLQEHLGTVNVVAFSPDGTTVVSANDNAKLSLWDVNTGKEIHTLIGHTDSIISASFSPDGSTILSASYDSTLKFWNTVTGKETRTFNNPTGPFTFAAFSPDGNTIVSSDANNTFKLWDTISGNVVRVLSGHTDIIIYVAYSPDGKTILSKSQDGTIKLWDATIDRERHILGGHKGWVFSTAFSPDGKTIVSASYDGTLKLWDVASSELLRTFYDHNSTCFATFSPDGKTILSANYDKTLKLWDVASSQILHTFSKGTDVGCFANFSPDGTTIVSAGLNNSLQLWDFATGNELQTLQGHSSFVTAATFSPDGKTIISASNDETLILWGAATGKRLRTLSSHTGPVSSATFSPNGTLIVSASEDHTLKLWDTATGNELRTLTGHTKWVNSATFSPDGKTILSASDDLTLKLWNVSTGKEARTLNGHTAIVRSAAFSPDGKWIVSASDDGTVRIWVASIEDLLQMAEKRIQRPVHQLTDAERLQYGLEEISTGQ